MSNPQNRNTIIVGRIALIFAPLAAGLWVILLTADLMGNVGFVHLGLEQGNSQPFHLFDLNIKLGSQLIVYPVSIEFLSMVFMSFAFTTIIQVIMGGYAMRSGVDPWTTGFGAWIALFYNDARSVPSFLKTPYNNYQKMVSENSWGGLGTLMLFYWPSNFADGLMDWYFFSDGALSFFAVVFFFTSLMSEQVGYFWSIAKTLVDEMREVAPRQPKGSVLTRMMGGGGGSNSGNAQRQPTPQQGGRNGP